MSLMSANAIRAAEKGGPLLLRVPQAMGLLNIGRTTFYALVATGELELVKIGRNSYVRASALEMFVNELPPINMKSTAA